MFSNNAIEADRLILEESISQIQSKFPGSLQIDFIEEPEAINIRSKYDLVLTMAQGAETLKHLDRFPEHLIWNSSKAIRNCYRLAMSNTLIDMDVGYVPFHVLQTDEKQLPALAQDSSYWMKRSDFHAISDEDVSLVDSVAEVPNTLNKFQSRGVKEVILQKHIHGDIYKFYGVRGKFFRPIKVRDFLKSSQIPDFSLLESRVQKAANRLGLMIYGGDCVLDEQGNFHLIDLNDWPSFRICRPDAASAIASLALDYLLPLEKNLTAATVSRGL